MSEETETLEQTEIAEESTPEPTPEPEQQEQKPKNSIYESLFDIAMQEEHAEEEEQKQEEEVRRPPRSLSEALEEKPEEPKEETKEEPKEEEEPKSSEPEPEKTEPKKKKIKQVIDPDIPEDLRSNALSETPVEKNEDQEFVDSLLPEEKEVYELAKYASEKMPEYKGADTQWKSYINKTRNYINQRLKDDPHADLSNDEEYKAFISREKPRFTSADARKIEQEILVEKAEARAREKLKPEIERVRRQQELINLAPVVEKRKSDAVQKVKDAIPQEFRDILEKENGAEELQKTKPMEFSAIDAVATQALNSSSLLIDITSGAVQYDPSNQSHQALLDWVNQEQENFINSGQTQRDGKIFMRRERYYQLPEDKRSEYYTWTDDDLVAIIASRSKEAISSALEKQRQILPIYMNQAQPAPQPVQQPTVKPRAPSIASSPRPAPTEQKVNQPSNPLLQALGM